MSKGKLITFDPIVCTRIASLTSTRKALLSKRDNLFKLKKHLDTELSKDKLEAGEREKLLRDFGETIRELDRYAAGIKALDTDLENTVENAAQAELFTEMGEISAKVYLNPPKEEPPPKGESKKPVGRAPKQPEAPVAEGEDQHLAASINELDVREVIKGQVVKGGFETIAQVVKAIEAGGDLEEKFNVKKSYLAELLAAVEKYRKQHRRAGLEREREEAGGVA